MDVCLLRRQSLSLSLTQIVITIEPTMVERILHSQCNMSFWCPLSTTSLATCHSNIGVGLKKSDHIRPTYLKKSATRYCASFVSTK